jgi:hypothetical protein
MILVDIEDSSSLKRDIESGAVVNVNHQEYREYMEMKTNKLNELTEKKLQEAKINNLEKDVSEIKQLLLQLIKEKKNAD